MKRHFSLICLFLFAGLAYAQKSDEEIAADFADLTLELDGAISLKLFQKTWKEEQAGWEEGVRSASDPGQLCKLLISLEEQTKKEKVFSKEWSSARNKWVKRSGDLKNWNDFVELLLEFEAEINSSAYSKAWDGHRLEWNRDVRRARQAYIAAEKLKNPEIHIDGMAFKAEFEKIFRQSVKGLGTIKVGDGVEKNENNKKVKVWGTGEMMPGALTASIRFDPEIDVSMYIASYKAGATKENAKKIMAQLSGLTSSAIPAGFAKQEKYSAHFVDYKQVYFEWDSDKFADVQKRPTVTIGIQREADNSYSVELIIAEPYFKNQYKF